MATPPVLAFLLLLLVSSFSHASAAAVLPAHSNPNPFPTTTPLHLQARRQQRVRQPNSPADATKLAAAGGTGTTAGPFTAHYFQQELDHFSFTPNASTVFYQKYLVNDTFWRRPGGGGTAGPRCWCTSAVRPTLSASLTTWASCSMSRPRSARS